MSPALLIPLLVIIGIAGSAHGFLELDEFPYRYDDARMDLYLSDNISFHSWHPHEAYVTISAHMEPDYLEQTRGVRVNYTLTDDRGTLKESVIGVGYAAAVAFYYPFEGINGTEFTLHVNTNNGISDIIRFTMLTHVDCYPRHYVDGYINAQAIRELCKEIRALEGLVTTLRADLRSEVVLRESETHYLLSRITNLGNTVDSLQNRIASLESR